MVDLTAPEIRQTIRRDLELQGYSIERSRVPGLRVRRPQGSCLLFEGMLYRDGEEILAIMQDRDCYLVITASRGGFEGVPYLFGFQEAEEAWEGDPTPQWRREPSAKTLEFAAHAGVSPKPSIGSPGLRGSRTLSSRKAFLTRSKSITERTKIFLVSLVSAGK